MRLLAIETSCDETAAAVLEDGRQILSSIVSSQVAVHAPHGGVVPELASRHHLENIAPVIRAALDEAHTTLAALDALAVTQGPGLVGALLVGVQVAKGLAYTCRKPLVPVHHVAGHIEAPFLAYDDIALPAIALVVSGGHTSLFEVPERGRYRLLVRTRDDAAGEAFDKVAKLLGLGYPGGPIIDRLARGANDRAVDFPLPKMSDGRPGFSFSGLKTSVLHHVRRTKLQPVADPARVPDDVRDIVASFQRAAVMALVRELARVVEERRPASVILTGGVAANSRLRVDAEAAAARLGVRFYVPPLSLTTDNAAMIGAAGYLGFERGDRAALDLNAEPTLPLEGSRG